ncbi:FAD-dependent oxidoreductase, partial [Brevundimonas sp.]|uniref:FAD-dependent oxidoreductase n=1 Tax=Brevundimonas sp. TaxID=1871086 RepID=UPI00391D2D89
LAPATAALIDGVHPIRGQLAFIPQALTDRVVRGAGAYVAPAPGGAVIGATMEAGQRALDINAPAGARQTAAGLALVGATSGDQPQYRVGIRGASADGLPLAGPSGEAGLYLALAPRRNGWLLAPLTARIVADAIEGRDADVHAATFDPLRFG